MAVGRAVCTIRAGAASSRVRNVAVVIVRQRGLIRAAHQRPRL